MRALILSTVLLLMLTTMVAQGQTLTYTAIDTIASAPPGHLAYLFSQIQNLLPQPQLLWVGLYTQFPNTGWTATYCFAGSCYIPEFSPISFTIGISPDDTERVSLDVEVGQVGSDGWAAVFVYPDGHPEQVDSLWFHIYNAAGIEPTPGSPAQYELFHAYPNPFNASVNLTFNLKGSGTADLAVYDLQGNRVAQIFQGHAAPGEHRGVWNPGDLASGIYLARLSAPGTQEVRKVVYLR